MLLIIDNYDSFTYNLIDYFEQLGEECILIENDSPRDQWPASPEKIVISPGPMDPERAGNLMGMLKYYIGKAPILGICLGHQALGIYFGASLIHAIKPMHGKISEINCMSDELFAHIPENFNIVRYHSLVLKDLPETIEPLAYTNENELMAFRHTQLPVYGIQFHPEAALTEYGLELLKNWLNCIERDYGN